MMPHLLACTVFGLAASAAALALRAQRAAWRHAILLAALLRFALPTEWLTRAGAAMAPVVRIARPVSEDLGWLLTGSRLTSAGGVMPSRANLQWWCWIAGIMVVLAASACRSFVRIPAVRMPDALEMEVFQRAGGAGVELRIVAAGLAPGAWGWWKPRVILPDGLSATLTVAELEAVLLHELAHVRRRDNLIAAVARAVVAVFWFHPLVWWLDRRMLAERETACDEMVLVLGTRAEDYIAGIWKVCRMSFEGAAGYAGVTGSNLANRMEHIMTMNLSRRGSKIARGLLCALIMCVALVPMAGGYLRAQQTPPQEKPRQADDPASVRELMEQVESLVNQGQTDRAIETLQLESAKNPSRMDLKLALGNTAVRTGRYDLAIATFHGVLAGLDKDSPKTGDLYLRLGETYRRKGDADAALANLRRATEVMPDNPVAMTTLALVLESAGKTTDAIREYRAILERTADNGPALNNLAYLLSQNGGDLDEALALAQRAHDVLPQSEEVTDTLGWIYLKKNLPDQAIAAFNQAVQSKPASASFRYHLGMALAQKGDTFAAAQQLKAALERNPSPEDAEKIRRLLERIGH